MVQEQQQQQHAEGGQELTECQIQRRQRAEQGPAQALTFRFPEMLPAVSTGEMSMHRTAFKVKSSVTNR